MRKNMDLCKQEITNALIAFVFACVCKWMDGWMEHMTPIFRCLIILWDSSNWRTIFNSIQDYLYSAFYDTIVAKQLYRKLSFYNISIYCRNLIYFYLMAKFGNSVCCLRVGILWGVGIISSQVFGHLRSFKGWIQTEACVIPSNHGMSIPWQKQRNK